MIEIVKVPKYVHDVPDDILWLPKRFWEGSMIAQAYCICDRYDGCGADAGMWWKGYGTGRCWYFKGASWAEWVGRSHVAVENIVEHWRMLGMKFYVTHAQICMNLLHTIFAAITLQLSLLLPTLMRLVFHYHMKGPYHTSILSGYAWAQYLLHGHPKHTRTKLGVHKEVFLGLVEELQSMWCGDTGNVTLQEQLAIFLYISVTGLSICHAGEQFQHANATISKWALQLSLMKF